MNTLSLILNQIPNCVLLITPIEVCTHLKSLKGLHCSYYKTDTWKGEAEKANTEFFR